MSDISPVIQKEEEARVLFPALKIVAGCGGEAEIATRRKNSNDRSPKV
jgi:hypothetical protein